MQQSAKPIRFILHLNGILRNRMDYYYYVAMLNDTSIVPPVRYPSLLHYE